MVETAIKIDGLDRLRKRIGNVEKNLKNPSREMRTIANIWMFKDIQSHFNQECSPSGKWASNRRGGKILQDTGKLRNSVRPRNTKDEAIVGTNLTYGAIHNYGGGNMTMRKFLWLSKGAMSRILKSLGKFFISK